MNALRRDTATGQSCMKSRVARPRGRLGPPCHEWWARESGPSWCGGGAEAPTKKITRRARYRGHDGGRLGSARLVDAILFVVVLVDTAFSIAVLFFVPC